MITCEFKYEMVLKNADLNDFHELVKMMKKKKVYQNLENDEREKGRYLIISFVRLTSGIFGTGKFIYHFDEETYFLFKKMLGSMQSDDISFRKFNDIDFPFDLYTDFFKEDFPKRKKLYRLDEKF